MIILKVSKKINILLALIYLKHVDKDEYLTIVLIFQFFNHTLLLTFMKIQQNPNSLIQLWFWLWWQEINSPSHIKC